MDKKIVMSLLSSALALILILCINVTNINKNSKMDALKFKTEYESLNGKKNKNNKEYVHVEINKNNPFVYASFDEVIDTLKNGTGVIYFGFPECPWCRNMVSVLLDAANEMGIDKIYYFNALEMRDIKSLNEDGSIKIDKAGTDEYYELVSALGDSIGAYEGLNDDSIKRLYFPTVVFVKNGKILSSHIGTLDSQTDPYKTLSSSQKNELKDIYMSGINKVFEIMCDEAC